MTQNRDQLDLMCEWHQRWRKGEHVSAEQLCPDDPQMQAALRQEIELQKALHLRFGLTPQEPIDSVRVADPADRTVPSTPGFEILEVLGRGGMGVVYKARQTRLNRVVALKTILSGSHAGTRERQRFLAEAEQMAALQHPGIVQIYEFGDHEGLLFLALEYCPGGTLARKLGGTPLPPSEAATLVEQVARAVQAAHARKIVHRDLKPENILLDTAGHPKVGDFGLARVLGAEAGLTRPGMVMGTPSYMPPEQARGQTKEVGPTADIWAVGAILYACLTGRPPFLGASDHETLAQVVADDPVRPRQLNPTVPRDLETVCLKCLQKEPTRRYASAEELGQDLVRFLGGEPIKARPVGKLERGAKWVRRHRAVAGLLAAVTSLLIAGTALSWGLAGWALREKGRAEGATETARQEARRANEKSDEAARHARQLGDQLYLADVRLGLELLHSGYRMDLPKLLDRHRPASGVAGPGFEWHYLSRFGQGGRRVPLLAHDESRIVLLAYSADGKSLVTADPQAVKVWDTATRQLRFSKPSFLKDTHQSVAFVPDSPVVAVVDDETKRPGGRTIALYRLASGEVEKRWVCPEHVEGLSMAPDGRTLLIWQPNGGWLWDLAGNQPAPERCPWFPRTTRKAVLLDRTTLLASTSGAGHLGVVNLVTKQQQYRAPEWSECVASTRDARWLAAGHHGLTICSAVEGWTERPDGHNGVIQAVAFSSDDRYLASVDQHGALCLFDLRTRTSRGGVRWQTRTITALAFTPAGRELVAGTVDGMVHWIDTDVPPHVEKLEPAFRCGHAAPAFSPDGKTLAVGGPNRRVYLLDVEGNEQANPPSRVRAVLKEHPAEVHKLVFSPDGRTLATLDVHRRVIRLWDPVSAKEKGTLARPSLHSIELGHLAFSPSGRWLAATSGPEVVLWDPHTRTEKAVWGGHAGYINALAWLNDDSTLITAAGDHQVRFWDVGGWLAKGADRPAAPPLKGSLDHGMPVGAVAVSPDGRMIATSAETNAVGHLRLWEVTPVGKASEKKRWPLTHLVSQLQFTPDGRELLVVGSGRDLYKLDLSADQSHFVAFQPGGTWRIAQSPNGRLLAMVTAHQVVELWEMQSVTARLPFGPATWPVRSLAYTPDGKELFVGHQVNRPRIEQRMRVSVFGFATPEQRHHCAPWRCASDGVSRWDLANERQESTPLGPMTLSAAELVAVSPTEPLLAGGAPDGSVWVWHLEGRRPAQRLFVSEQARGYAASLEVPRNATGIGSPDTNKLEGVQALDFSPDGRTLAVASTKGVVTLWDTGNWSERQFRSPVSGLQWLRFSPDSQTLVSGGPGGEVRLWDPQTTQLRATLGNAGDPPTLSGAFSPDGATLITGTKDGPIRVWDLREKRERLQLSGHLDRVEALAFAPDGRTIASGSWDRSVRLWHVATGREIGALTTADPGKVRCLAFRPDGGELIAGADSGEVIRWRTGPAEGRGQR